MQSRVRMTGSANGMAKEPQAIKPFIGKTTKGWLVSPGNQRFRTLREAKKSAAQIRRGNRSLNRETPGDVHSGGEPCAIVGCRNHASRSFVVCSSCNAGCDEIAGGQIVRVECGWNIIEEVRPGQWTQILGPFANREQARKLKRRATEVRDSIAESAERAWREERIAERHGRIWREKDGRP
jgi:hypothetical protein